jgi:DNA-binding LacI/PurR family transcriptional regulator
MSIKPNYPDSSNGSPARISDIARECGLSAMTISRAMRNAYGVNPATRQRVLQVAERMGYIRNQIASNLVRRCTQTVGVVIPDVDRSIFPAVLKGIESVVGPEGYGILLFCSYDSTHREVELAQALLEQRADGIILVPTSIEDGPRTIEMIERQHRPLVLMDRLVPGFDGDSVTVDDEEGAYRATRHLIDQGFERIVHLAGPPTIWTARERLRGFCRAMQESGRKRDADQVVATEFAIEAGYEAMEKVLAAPRRPDAVFCANDPIAMGAYKALQHHGIDIPHEMGLVGFSDTLEADLMGVPLTTVAQHPLQMGRHSGRLLLNRMRGGSRAKLPPQNVVVKTRLVVRASSVRNGSARPIVSRSRVISQSAVD